MDELLALFRFGPHPLELVVRGSAVYLFLFLLFRFVLRRDAGAMSLADLLLLVVIADASQNAVAGSYETVADGFLLVGTIATWNWLMDWGSYHSNLLRRLLEPAPLVLVRRGRMIARNMRREFITTPELMASLREHGIDKLAQVRMARMETDGTVSVIRQRGPAPGADDDKPSTGASKSVRP